MALGFSVAAACIAAVAFWFFAQTYFQFQAELEWDKQTAVEAVAALAAFGVFWGATMVAVQQAIVFVG